MQLFARIELRGTPGTEIYERLHEHMRKLNWSPTVTGGTATVSLPHATYQAKYADGVEIMSLANQLKAGIEGNVWTKALVLIIHSVNWAQTSG